MLMRRPSAKTLAKICKAHQAKIRKQCQIGFQAAKVDFWSICQTGQIARTRPCFRDSTHLLTESWVIHQTDEQSQLTTIAPLSRLPLPHISNSGDSNCRRISTNADLIAPQLSWSIAGDTPSWAI
jgi:hypothetical protein